MQSLLFHDSGRWFGDLCEPELLRGSKGTGGTLKSLARVLAKERPETKIVVYEPTDAQLLTTGVAQSRNSDGTPAAPHPTFKPHGCKGGELFEGCGGAAWFIGSSSICSWS
jgi:hypothetical protein